MARLDYEEREGKLIDASKVRDDAFQTGRMVRDGLLAIPDRMPMYWPQKRMRRQ